MNFSIQEDVDAPCDKVFASITDIDHFEKAARRRGAEVERFSDEAVPAEGAAWRLNFMLQEKRRELEIKITRCDPPLKLAADLSSPGVAGTATVELFALSDERTRMTVSVDLQATTWSSRLLIQSLKLAKTQIVRKFQDRVSGLAREIETRHRKTS